LRTPAFRTAEVRARPATVAAEQTADVADGLLSFRLRLFRPLSLRPPSLRLPASVSARLAAPLRRTATGRVLLRGVAQPLWRRRHQDDRLGLPDLCVLGRRLAVVRRFLAAPAVSAILIGCWIALSTVWCMTVAEGQCLHREQYDASKRSFRRKVRADVTFAQGSRHESQSMRAGGYE
jgi:hypothetical protein